MNPIESAVDRYQQRHAWWGCPSRWSGSTAGVNAGMLLLGFWVLTPRQVRVRKLVVGAVVAGVAWQVLLVTGGYLVGLATQEERRPEESVQVSFSGQGDDARSDRSRDADRSCG